MTFKPRSAEPGDAPLEYLMRVGPEVWKELTGALYQTGNPNCRFWENLERETFRRLFRIYRQTEGSKLGRGDSELNMMEYMLSILVTGTVFFEFETGGKPAKQTEQNDLDEQDEQDNVMKHAAKFFTETYPGFQFCEWMQERIEDESL